MEKIILEKHLEDHLDKNYDKYSNYLTKDFKVFTELNNSVEEVIKCLMLEFDKAAITLTNNLLFRLLKLSLIYNEVGSKPVPIEKWESVFAEPNLKYGTLSLDKAIELCKFQNLITSSEKEYITDSIKKLIVNGYSNADLAKIVGIASYETVDPIGINAESPEFGYDDLNQKIIPPLQSIQIENFSRGNASRYFEFVFDLICNIEVRLINKRK